MHSHEFLVLRCAVLPQRHFHTRGRYVVRNAGVFALILVVGAAFLTQSNAQVPAWEQVSVSELLGNPSNYAGHLVRAGGYIVECTCSAPSLDCPFGCPKYSLYEATHEVAAVIPTDPNIALSWSETVDPLVSFVQFTYDGQQIVQHASGVPRTVWIIGTFLDRERIMDAPRYIIIVSSISWYETVTLCQPNCVYPSVPDYEHCTCVSPTTQTTTPACPPYQCPIGQVYDASCHCVSPVSLCNPNCAYPAIPDYEHCTCVAPSTTTAVSLCQPNCVYPSVPDYEHCTCVTQTPNPIVKAWNGFWNSLRCLFPFLGPCLPQS